MCVETERQSAVVGGVCVSRTIITRYVCWWCVCERCMCLARLVLGAPCDAGVDVCRDREAECSGGRCV